jgi:hypothetical protein
MSRAGSPCSVLSAATSRTPDLFLERDVAMPLQRRHQDQQSASSSAYHKLQRAVDASVSPGRAKHIGSDLRTSSSDIADGSRTSLG